MLVSNYTESLILCDKVSVAAWHCWRQHLQHALLEMLIMLPVSPQPRERTIATHKSVFSTLQPVPPLPAQACKANRWATLSLTGDLDARKRQALVDEFNSPAHPSFVLLLSSKAGGVSAAARRHGQGRWQMAGKQ